MALASDGVSKAPGGWRVVAFALGGGVAPLAALVALLAPGAGSESGLFTRHVAAWMLGAVFGLPLLAALVARAAARRNRARAAWKGACFGLLFSAIGVSSNFVQVAGHQTRNAADPNLRTATPWTSYFSAAGGYRIAFPGPPAVEARNGGESATVMLADAGFSAAHVPQAPHTHPAELFALVGERYRETFVEASVRDRAIYAGGRLGRELDVRGANGQDMRIRLFLVNDVLYQVSVNGSPPLDAELVERFFDSFVLRPLDAGASLGDDLGDLDGGLLDGEAGEPVRLPGDS